MRKFLKGTTIVFMALLIMASFSGRVQAKAIEDKDFIKTNDTYLRNQKGTGSRIVLRGVNVGGMFIQELWMCPTKETRNVKDQKTIEKTLITRFGEDGAEELLNTYYDNFWTEADFDNCSNLGINCLRLPIWYKNIVDDYGNVKGDAFDRIDWFVEQAGQRGIYVIIDMHGAPGSQNDKDHSGDISSNMGLWQGADAMYNQSLYIEIWKSLVKHYKDNPTVAGYDLLNEPYCAAGEYTDETVWNLYDRTYDAIRNIDKDHIIIMEGTWEPYNLPNPQKYGWTNVMYEYHCYNYNNQTDQEEQLKTVKNKINLIKKMNYNVPSYIGETSFFSNTKSWEKCLNELNNNELSWTIWSYKVVGQGTNSWGIYNVPIESANIEKDSFDEIKEKWSKINSTNAIPNKDILPIVEKNIPYSLYRIMIGDATIGSVANQIYTGKEIKPNFNIKINGYSLNNGTDYTVKYENNIQCGVATATITGIGKYDGIRKVTFNIIPNKVTMKNTKFGEKSISIQWKKNLNTDGYLLYKYEKGKYKLIKDLKAYNTSYKITGLKPGNNYIFKIKTYKVINSKKYEGQATTLYLATKTKAPKVKVKVKNKNILISLNKVKGANGYKIYVSNKRKGKYKKIKTLSASKRKYTYKTKKSGLYYVKVSAYVKTGRNTIDGSETIKKIIIK